MEKSQLRNSLKTNRGRAEIIQAVMELADSLLEDVDEQSKTEWEQIKSTFFSLLNN